MVYKHRQGLILPRTPNLITISANNRKPLKSSGKDTKIWRVTGNYFCADLGPEKIRLRDKWDLEISDVSKYFNQFLMFLLFLLFLKFL